MDLQKKVERTGKGRPPWEKLDPEPNHEAGGFIPRLRVLLSWLYPELRPYRWHALGSWLLLTALSGASAVPVILAREIVEDFEGTAEKLPLHLSLLGLAIAVTGLLRFLGSLMLATVSFKVRHALEEKYVRRLAAMPLSYYENNTSGNISLAPFNQIPFVTGLIQIGFRNFLQAPTTILAVLAILFYVDLSIGVYSLLLVPFFFLAVRSFGRSTERSVRRTFGRIADLHSYILESLISVKSIRTLGISEKRVGEVSRLVGDTMSQERKTLLLTGTHRFVLEVVFAVGMVAALLVMHAQFEKGAISLSFCAVALTGFALLTKEVRVVANGIMQLRRTAGASTQIVEFLTQPVDTTLRGTREGPAEVSSLSLVGVTFSYGDNNDVLRDAEMSFNKGEITGIVGMSGAGKSTVADLLLRLRRPTKGQVSVNGEDISEFREEWIRKTFAFVDQEPFLFNTTVKENLLLAAPEMDNGAVEEALESASAAGFVRALPDGLDSLVGEGGCLLSVGQKQRIAIARAIAGQPSVLVLDEITSAVDAENERIILDALRKLAPERIIILISHKSEVAGFCDRVYRLDDGTATVEGG